MAAAAVASMQEVPAQEAADQVAPKIAKGLLSLPGAALRRAFRAAHTALASGNRGYGASFLEGNFKPVPTETPPTPLTPTTGALPPSLHGSFLRNGPNPFFSEMPGGYHWFDGDGMVHCVRLRGDSAPAVYSSHFVRTRRLEAEKKAGWPCHPKLGDFVGAQGLGILLLDRLYVSLGLDKGERRAHGNGTANTALAHHANRILALNEGDLPYSLRIACGGLVETIGRVTFNGAFGADGSLTAAAASSSSSSGGKNPTTTTNPAQLAPVTSFTAHPKLDPRTGELHAFRYTFDGSPYAYYLCLGADGQPKAPPHPLTSLPRATMMHDFAVTKRHAVFFDLPLVFDGGRMLKEKQLPFRFAPEHGSRVGLLPFSRALGSGGGGGEGGDNNSKGDGVEWYEVDAPFMMFHTAACWEEEEEEEEEEDKKEESAAAAAPGPSAKEERREQRPAGVVKVVVGHHHTISLDLDKRCATTGKKRNGTSDACPPPLPSIPPEEKPHMALLTLDPKTKKCAARRLTKIAGDFPVINPRHVGAKARYVWFAALSDEPGRTVKFDGIAKVDLAKAEGGAGGGAGGSGGGEEAENECVVGRIKLPDSMFCGEAVFAPRYEDPALCKGEDDGWLLTFGHDEKKGESWFFVFDASTMAPEPVAAFKLPSRVPFGFHGLWAPEAAVQAARVADAADVL